MNKVLSMLLTVFILVFSFTVNAVEQAAPIFSKQPVFDLKEITVEQLQQGYLTQKFSIQDVTEYYLQQIAKLNKKGPKLNAVIATNPDAIRIAKQLDQELKNRGSRGPLHGIPVLLKDNIESKDAMATTAGSLALKQNFAQRDAPLVAALRKAGAVILGKSNLSEWANFRSTTSSSGWSAIGGQTRNPYVLTTNPCGSSSGSGVAVAANLTVLAVGTETDGSIICPCAANGIVGIKPSVGLISRTGIIPLAATQDTAGPMARTVSDAVYMLNGLISQDDKDSLTQRQPKGIDYSRYLKKDGLKNKRIGVIDSPFTFHPGTEKLFVKAKTLLVSQGAELVENIELLPRSQFSAAEYEVLLYEFKSQLNRYLTTTPKSVNTRTLKELIEFNQKNSIQEMSFFGQEIFLASEKKGDLTEKLYIESHQKSHQAMQKNLQQIMKDNRLDALIAPSLNAAWSIDLTHGDNFTGSSSSYAAVSGFPSITVPMGFVNQLPVGISFIGLEFSETTLIEIAYSYEQNSLNRKMPTFIHRIDQ